MIEKKSTTQVPIHELLARRWSGRAYDAQHPVQAAALIALLEAARWAPSCYGDEPWRFLVCDKHADAAAWQAALDCLAAGNQSWAQNAPILILASAATRLRNGSPNRWGGYDTGAAMMSLCLQATALGLMCHQMGGFDAKKSGGGFSYSSDFYPHVHDCAGLSTGQRGYPRRPGRAGVGRTSAPAPGRSFFLR